ncbi:general odorant-binding protein 2-like [Cydia amplana]|uniref:general odorant-binding protein 2-like n=1 Tax=Cydia amplana TaxID=1869771 RepID=UPI002FE6A8B3
MALYWVVFALVLAAAEMDASSDESIVMSRVTGKFGKTLEGCRDEAKLTSDTIKGWEEVWDYDIDVDRREIGWAIICMSHKFSLLQDDNHVQHDNLLDYLKTFDNGDAVAATVTNLFLDCQKKHGHINDDCSRTAKLLVCFREEAKTVGIAPYVDLVKDVIQES